MNIFNSLGSNYDTSYVLKSLLLKEQGSLERLANFLEKKYKGEVFLFYKARQAITQALILSKIPENSSVAICGFTCIAVVDSVKEAKLHPVFLDIEQDALNFTPQELKKIVEANKNIKAVIIQNTLGYPCDIEKIKDICQKNKLVLIEDLAHSIGTVYENGKEAGTVGDFTILSFSQDKVIDGVSGGALIIRNHSYQVNSKKLALRSSPPSFQDKYYPVFTLLIRKMYPYGIGKMLHVFLKTFGLLSNPMKMKFISMTDFHAMLTLEEFRQIEKNLHHRRQIANIYIQNLPAKLLSKSIMQDIKNSTHVRFPVQVANREILLEKLEDKGIHISDTWYDTPIGPKKYFKKSGYRVGECPNSEKVSKEILNLPTHKNVSEKDALTICNIINTWEK